MPNSETRSEHTLQNSYPVIFKLDEQLTAVYDELRAIASSHLSHRQRDHELHTTAIVHEAYLKLRKSGTVQVKNHSHFLMLAARAMRYLIIDFFRKSQAEKRAGWQVTINLNTVPILAENHSDAYLHLHEALDALAALDEQQSRIVELRFFGGLTIEETAAALGVSPATVKREWRSARAWLHRELQQKSK